jgi:ribonuclease HI
MGKYNYYGVAVGRKPGVYTDWPSTQRQVSGYSGGTQKGFKTFEEAVEFVKTHNKNYSAPISMQGHLSASASPSATGMMDRGRDVSENAPKRQKRGHASPALIADHQDVKVEPGYGPLPPDAVDGFDPNIKLDEQTGKIRDKTVEELGKRKRQPTGHFKGPVRVYTDGGSRGNGQVGAYAGCGVYFGPKDPRFVGGIHHVPYYGNLADTGYRNVQQPLRGELQTNNRAELVAIARAIDHVAIDRDMEIITDSRYSRDCLTEWVRGWERRGWKNSQGKEVMNKDIIQPILARIREREKSGAKTTITWVKAHDVDQGNIAADAFANQAMDKWTVDLASGSTFDMSETLRTKYRNPNGPPSPKQEFGDAEEIEEYFRELEDEKRHGYENYPLAQDVQQSSREIEQAAAASAQDIDDVWAEHPRFSSKTNGEENEEPEAEVVY